MAQAQPTFPVPMIPIFINLSVVDGLFGYSAGRVQGDAERRSREDHRLPLRGRWLASCLFETKV
jgi:hypothetical protein